MLWPLKLPKGYTIDRLSTPAASTAEPFDWSMVRNALACDCNLTDDQCCDKCQTLNVLIQLQARNAEQARELRVRGDYANDAWQRRAEAAESKYQALLDGIEGLEKAWAARIELLIDLNDDDGAEIVDDCLDGLRTLRESSVPAPNPEGSGAT